jgi:hypothetical protein
MTSEFLNPTGERRGATAADAVEALLAARRAAEALRAEGPAQPPRQAW